jgi:hypothetical protein
MPVTPSKVGAIIDALVAACQASPTFTDPNGPVLYDGPGDSSDNWKDATFIGFDGDWEGGFQAVALTQTWAYVGGTSRFEQMDIHCAAISWSGENTPKVHRDAALLMVAAVETVIRTDPTLGLDNSVVAELTVGDMFQAPFRDGQECRILFTIAVRDQTLTT